MENVDKLAGMRKLWVAFSEYYGRNLSDMQIEMYAADSMQCSIEEIYSAMSSLRKNPETRAMPMPAQVIATARPETLKSDPKKTAAEIATVILDSVSRHGYVWNDGIISHQRPGEKYYRAKRGDRYREFSTWEEAARFEMGDAGYETARRWGWKAICEYDGDRAILQAQLRQFAESVIEKAEQNKLDDLPALPNRPQSFEQITNYKDSIAPEFEPEQEEQLKIAGPKIEKPVVENSELERLIKNHGAENIEALGKEQVDRLLKFSKKDEQGRAGPTFDFLALMSKLEKQNKK